MGADELWQEINSVIPAERKERFKEILVAQRQGAPLPPPGKPPVPPAPGPKPKPKPKVDPNLVKPDKGGGSGGPKDQEENKPLEPPDGWPGEPEDQPGEDPELLDNPEAEDLPESGKDPSKKGGTRGRAFPIELSGGADVLKRPRSDRVDPTEPPIKCPTKGKGLPTCRVTLKPMKGSDRLLQVTSDGEAYDDH